MKELISVVVPIYNVENYLKKCIESIINQTYDYIEIILVDDGSTDKSGEICDEYEKIDTRIQVIHKENGGLSDARNSGLRIARGEYIAFIDSDDFIEKNFIEVLYKLCKENNAEIAQCEFGKVGYEKFNIVQEKKDTEILIKTGKQMIYDIYNGKHMIYTVAWNKLYKRSLFKGIEYPKGKINEDEATTYKLFYKATKVVITNQKLYNDVYRKNSIMNRKYNIKRLDGLWAFERRMEFFKEKNEKELLKLTQVAYAYELMRSYGNVREYIENSNEIQKDLLKKHKKIAIKLLKEDVGIKQKLIFIYQLTFPKLYSRRLIQI